MTPPLTDLEFGVLRQVVAGSYPSADMLARLEAEKLVRKSSTPIMGKPGWVKAEWQATPAGRRVVAEGG